MWINCGCCVCLVCYFNICHPSALIKFLPIHNTNQLNFWCYSVRYLFYRRFLIKVILMLGYCCVFKIDYRNLNNMVYLLIIKTKMDTLQHIIPQIKQKDLQKCIVKIMNLLIINIKMNYSFGMGKNIYYPCR